MLIQVLVKLTVDQTRGLNFLVLSSPPGALFSRGFSHDSLSQEPQLPPAVML